MKRFPREGARLTKVDHRLIARYYKDDLHVDLTPRFGNGELHIVMDRILSKDIRKELKELGYDLDTLHFHIDKTPEAIEEHERRAGRRPG